MQVLLNNRIFPLAKVIKHYNEVLVSPWTGECWCRIDRGQSEWFPTRRPKMGEPYWPHPECTPGELVTSYDDWRDKALDELSMPLLEYELRAFERFTSATLSGNIGATNQQTGIQMMPSTNLMDKIAEVRLKVINGTVTPAELREALRTMRAERISAAARSTASRAAKKEVSPEDALKAFLG